MHYITYNTEKCKYADTHSTENMKTQYVLNAMSLKIYNTHRMYIILNTDNMNTKYVFNAMSLKICNTHRI